MSLTLLPPPKIQLFDNSGNVLNGGLVYTYEAGTTTPKATYSDAAGTTENANPVVLDSSGRATIFLSGSYKIVVKTSAGTTLYTVDDVSDVASMVEATSEWKPTGLTPTYLSATTFSVPGDQTLVFETGRRVKSTVTADTIYSTVTGASFASSITTVTVINDSGSLDSGLSKVETGLLSVASPALPVFSTVTKTDDYVMTAADVNKIFIANKGTAIAFTLKASNAVPNGTWIRFKNIGAGTLTLTGTVDGASNPTLVTNEEMLIFSDGSAWRGSKLMSFGAAGYPVDVAASESDGTATSAARSDHQHKMGILTTKGDLLVYESAPARLGVGADGSILTADAASTPGFKWSNSVIPSYVYKSADQTLAVSGWYDVTSLSFSVAANKDYEFEFLVLADVASGGTVTLGVNGPAAPTRVQFVVHGVATDPTVVGAFGNAYDDTGPVITPGATSVYLYKIHGILRNGANAGTLALRINFAGSGYVRAGSSGSLRTLN